VDACLREESVDFEGGDARAGIAIEASKDGEGLEIGVTGEVLSLSLDEDFLFGDCLEKVLKFKLGFYSNHNFICYYKCANAQITKINLLI